MNNHFFPFLSLFFVMSCLVVVRLFTYFLHFYLFKYVVCVTRGRLLSCLIGFPAYSSIWFCCIYVFFLDVFCCSVFYGNKVELNWIELKNLHFLLNRGLKELKQMSKVNIGRWNWRICAKLCIFAIGINISKMQREFYADILWITDMSAILIFKMAIT